MGLTLGYASAPSEKNKKVVRKFSARFLAFSNEISTVQKMVLSSIQGQGNFRGLEASRPRTSKCVPKDVLEAKDVLKDSTFALLILLNIDRFFKNKMEFDRFIAAYTYFSKPFFERYR